LIRSSDCYGFLSDSKHVVGYILNGMQSHRGWYEKSKPNRVYRRYKDTKFKVTIACRKQETAT